MKRTRAHRTTIRKLLHKVNKWKAPYLFISPFYIMFAVFGLYPLGYSIFLSFHRWQGFGPWRAVGLTNYRNLFTNKAFLSSLINMLYLAGVFMPILIMLSLVIAFLLSSSSIRARGFFRSACILPFLMIPTVAAVVFNIIFETKFGLVNQFLQLLRLPPIHWIDSEFWIKPTLSLILMWEWLGFYMIIMLGGLQIIDPNIYEAAQIDGASAARTFFSITIPLMIRVILFCTIIATIWIVLLFDLPFIMTAGGPGYAAFTPGIFIFTTAFKNFSLGLGSAASIMTCLLLVTIGFLQLKLFPKYE